MMHAAMAVLRRVLAATALAAGLGSAAAAQATPPSILFILADDLGWHDIGFTGSGIATPSIDAILSGGVRLDQMYGMPVCSPSRAAIHTGRYPIAYGLQTYVIDPPGVDYGVNLNETTLPQLLRDRGGYSTWHVGKHHMGMSRWEYTPTFRGYDFFHGYYSGGQDYYTHVESGGFDLHLDDGRECGANCSVVDWANQGTYSAELYASAAIGQLQKHAAAYPPGSASAKPFFMYLAFQSVHSPAQVPDRYVPSPCTLGSAERCTFAGMVRALDEAVGNVTAALKATGLDENTLIVLVADNGGPIASPVDGDAVGSSNWPLRGGKHGLFEGGVRLVSALRGPMLKQPAGGWGGNVSGLVHHTDWFPTFLEAAGIEYTPAPGFELHGSSAWGLLTRGEPSARNELLLNIDPCQSVQLPGNVKPGSAGIRIGDWKLLVGQTGPPWGWSEPDQVYDPALANVSLNAARKQQREAAVRTDAMGAAAPVARSLRLADRAALSCANQTWPLNNMTTALYNITADPFERNDVSAAHPDVVKQLMDRLTYWATEVQVVPYYATASTVDPASNPAKHNGTWIPWEDDLALLGGAAVGSVSV